MMFKSIRQFWLQKLTIITFFRKFDFLERKKKLKLNFSKPVEILMMIFQLE